MSTLTFRSLLVVGSLGLGLNVPIAEAHQCVDVRILHSPRQVAAGSQASMVAGVFNCGSCPTTAELDAWLYDPDSHTRVHLGGERVRLREGEFRRAKLLLNIPDNVAPGRYQLVLSGVTPGGFMDLARARISVVSRDFGDVRRLLMQLASDSGDAAAVEELLEMVDAYADELRPREVMPASGDITGKIVHKDKKKRKIRVKNAVGREKTVKVKPTTQIFDENGDPITFDDLHEGDRVEVEYDNNNVATRIDKLR